MTRYKYVAAYNSVYYFYLLQVISNYDKTKKKMFSHKTENIKNYLLK